MRALVLFALAFSPMFMAECGHISAIEEIYGTYVLHKPEATIELELRRDMTYVESIRFSDGQAVIIEGKWFWTVIEGEGTVHMNGFGDVEEELKPDLIPRIDTGKPALKWFGKMYLVVNDDYGLRFKRKTD